MSKVYGKSEGAGALGRIMQNILRNEKPDFMNGGVKKAKTPKK